MMPFLLLHAVCKKLSLNNFSSLESLGIAVINAEGDGKIPKIALSLKELGKTVFAIYDKQEDASKKKEIRKNVDHPFESPEGSFEELIVNHIDVRKFENLLSNYVSEKKFTRNEAACFKGNPFDFLTKYKGYGYAADLLVRHEKHEMPEFITSTLSEIKRIVEHRSAVLSASENNSSDK